jgi:diguanylate cyclase (GGDEF)-like protein
MNQHLQANGQWAGEIWSRRKNGEVFPGWMNITAVMDGRKKVSHYVATLTDITQRKLAEDQIRQLAFFDPLTNLPNRRLLMDRLQRALAVSERNKRSGAVLFIDLDHFKTLNDTLGHEKGDLLLQQVAKRLAGCVREGDTVARLGGDEFVVMLEELDEARETAADEAKTVGEKILALLNQTYHLVDLDFHSTPSIGVALYSGQAVSMEDLLKQADLAMYQAKSAGRNSMRFFDPAMQAVVNARAALESDLREGILRGQFVLYYQAQVDGLGCVTGAEALLRWPHPERGLVSPVEFIPLAEETGQILPLGNWVLETACAQLRIWAQQPERAHLTLAVNVSSRQFREPDFADYLRDLLDYTVANPKRLKLELTESMLADNLEDIATKMTTLRECGIRFSLDDFGTGYSSLSYLKRLPLDQLKIDQSFVRDILIDPNDAAIAKTVVALAQSLGLAVIAEGVETEAQKDFLARHGCHAYQGYLFSRPLPIEEFERFLSAGTDRILQTV